MNEFHKDLEYSLEDSDDFDKFYYEVFPMLDRIDVVTDMKLQIRGIDKILHLKNGKQITIDEKKRRKDYGDILIEEYSNFEQKKWGWLNREKHSDYIVYIVAPSKTVYLFPFLLLQKAWLKNYNEWLYWYGRRSAHNYDSNNNHIYTTTNIPIPTAVLIESIKQEMTSHYTG